MINWDKRYFTKCSMYWLRSFTHPYENTPKSHQKKINYYLYLWDTLKDEDQCGFKKNGPHDVPYSNRTLTKAQVGTRD